MKYLLLCFLLSFGFSINPLFSQDIAKEIMEKVFFEKKVYKIIFFDYKGVGEWPHRLPDGFFAFIIPDSIFQKQYPDILYELATSGPREKTLSTRTFIARPDGRIYVTNGSIHNGTYKLLVMFDQIKIDNDRAVLAFHTTSVERYNDMIGKYVRIIARLKKGKRGWKVKRLKIIEIPCCDNFSSTASVKMGTRHLEESEKMAHIFGTVHCESLYL